MYFAFGADAALLERIVSEHRMKRIERLPKLAEELVSLVRREANWWQHPNSAQDKIYWVAYAPTYSELEPAFRFLVVKGDWAFFITSGYFLNEYYVPDNS